LLTHSAVCVLFRGPFPCPCQATATFLRLTGPEDAFIQSVDKFDAEMHSTLKALAVIEGERAAAAADLSATSH
jgi:hypothetical protein